MLRRNRTVSCPSELECNPTRATTVCNHVCESVTGPRHISFPVEVEFHSAVQSRDTAELYRLLTKYRDEINVNAPNHTGITALHQGVLSKNLDCVKLLLTHGADVNVQDLHGHTPLHTASESGYLNIASMLIIFGADLFLPAKDGDLPVDLAKNSVIADMLTMEMCSQIQAQELREKYWLLFKLIDVWEIVRARLIEWHRKIFKLVVRGINYMLVSLNVQYRLSLRDPLSDT